jgi:serine/threonine-protein kinase
MQRGVLRAVRRRSSVLRWPLGIGAVVALVLVFGLWHVYQSQTGAIEDSTYGFGDALASLIAQETAEALILEDTTALSILVSDFSVNPQVDHLHVADAAGVVQASTNPFLQGQPIPPPEGPAVERGEGSVVLNRNDDELLQFSVPIRFQARRVGEIRLGLDGSGLQTTASATLGLLALVFAVTVLVVALGVGWMMRRQQRALQQLAWGLKRLGRGQLDFRLEVQRRDEFSDAFRHFNRLAVRLDEAHEASRTGTDDTGHAPPRLRPIQGTLDDTLDLSSRSAAKDRLSPPSGREPERLDPTVPLTSPGRDDESRHDSSRDEPPTEKLSSGESSVTPLHGDRKGR